MPATTTPATSPTLTGTSLSCRDQSDLKAFRAADGGGRGARLIFTTDHNLYPEIAEVTRRGLIVLMANREAVTGAAVVVCGEGLEVGRGATIAEALAGLEMAL